MLVPDYKSSEVGTQRRRASSGRALHCCCVCGLLDVWSSTWTTYCSFKDMDDGSAIPKFCSEECRTKGGPTARNVTAEMKELARDAEFRPPTIAYREATDVEKYRAAQSEQRHPRSNSPKSD